MSIIIITDVSKIDMLEWSDFLINHPSGNVFQSPYIYNVYKNSPKHSAYIFAAFKEKEIVGILLVLSQKHIKGIFSYFSSRAIIWGGPVVKDNDPEIVNELLQAYDRTLKKKFVYTQVRNLFPSWFCRNVFEKNNYIFEDHLDIIIDLRKDEELLWQEVNSKRRNEIRRAARENCTFEVREDEPSLLKCYNILKVVYGRAQLPLPDKRYFLNLLHHSDDYARLLIFAAIYKGEIIGCMLTLSYKNILFDFYAGAYQSHYDKYPNDLIPWEGFLWGKKNGYTIFDFGGAGKPGIHYGVREYKKQFGGEMVNYGRFEKVHSRFNFSIAKHGFRLWQKVKN